MKEPNTPQHFGGYVQSLRRADQPSYDQLVERIAYLEEEIAYLKGERDVETGHTALSSLKRVLGLTPAQGRIALALHARYPHTAQRWTLHDIATVADDTNDKLLLVHICRIRKVLGRDGIVTHNGIGYALAEKGKAKIDAALAS